jgi:hypothetical protein
MNMNRNSALSVGQKLRVVIQMADEYIRLDTTIIAIDHLINEVATGTMARTLFKAKDAIYSQQRYVIDVQPVKSGRWLNHHAIWIDQPKIEGWFVQAKCSECEKWAHVMNPYTKSVDYECCPHCGARMDGDTE